MYRFNLIFFLFSFSSYKGHSIGTGLQVQLTYFFFSHFILCECFIRGALIAPWCAYDGSRQLVGRGPLHCVDPGR